MDWKNTPLFQSKSWSKLGRKSNPIDLTDKIYNANEDEAMWDQPEEFPKSKKKSFCKHGWRTEKIRVTILLHNFQIKCRRT